MPTQTFLQTQVLMLCSSRLKILWVRSAITCQRNHHVLEWRDGNFTDSAATFCNTGSLVWAIFNTIKPVDCDAITLMAVPGK